MEPVLLRTMFMGLLGTTNRIDMKEEERMDQKKKKIMFIKL